MYLQILFGILAVVLFAGFVYVFCSYLKSPPSFMFVVPSTLLWIMLLVGTVLLGGMALHGPNFLKEFMK